MTHVSSADLSAARAWWLALAPLVPREAVGLWFGLTDLVDDGRRVTTLYVAGTSEFNLGDDDWASAIVWWPDDRYLSISGLHAIPAADWQRALEYALALVDLLSVEHTVPPTVEGIGVGWDDGDVHIIWSRSNA